MCEKRHTCIICKSKRNESKMINVFGSSWACKYKSYAYYCSDHPDIDIMIEIRGVS
jgi:hypothetical protein